MLIKKPDIGQEMTDEVLAELEKKIAKVYKEASRDVLASAEEYFARFEKRDEDMLKHLEKGDITEQQYKEWRIAQIGRGKRLEALADELSKRLTQADETAIDYLNKTTPTVYAANRNYTAYTIERSGQNIDYTLWNEATVQRLMTMPTSLTAVMPHYPVQRAINRGINLAYGQKMIKKTVLSGILQGLSVPKMAKYLADTVPEISKASALRAVRTATIGAQNAGRQDQMQDAVDKGIEMQKRWIAAHDYRTRVSHAMRDGTHIPVDQEWTSGLMFPGDPHGSPSEVYNCRCSQRAWFPELEGKYTRETYNEWYNRKVEEMGEEAVKQGFTKISNGKTFIKFKELIK